MRDRGGDAPDSGPAAGLASGLGAAGRAVALLAAVAAAAALAVPVLLIGLAAQPGDPPAGAALPAAPASIAPPAPSASTALPQGEAGPGVPASPEAVPTPLAPPVDAADLLAGLTGRTVPAQGDGTLVLVPGAVPAPGPGPVRTIRVEIEDGLPVDAEAFADFVLATLNDPRGWGAGGRLTFARTDGDAPIHLILATPSTADRLCSPLDTAGEVSCRNEQNVVLNFRRWVEATPEYADNPTGYRQYLVNHEVGHALGHGHQLCPAPGRPAPVMQQQTLGLNGCTENSWPYP